MNVPRILFGLFLVAVAGFSIWEASRWRDEAYTSSLTGTQKRRRKVGAGLLAVVAGMCFYGTYLPGPISKLTPLQAADQLVYWGVCLLCALGVPVVAWVEARETWRALAAERRRVIEETLLTDTAAIRKEKSASDEAPNA